MEEFSGLDFRWSDSRGSSKEESVSTCRPREPAVRSSSSPKPCSAPFGFNAEGQGTGQREAWDARGRARGAKGRRGTGGQRPGKSGSHPKEMERRRRRQGQREDAGDATISAGPIASPPAGRRFIRRFSRLAPSSSSSSFLGALHLQRQARSAPSRPLPTITGRCERRSGPEICAADNAHHRASAGLAALGADPRRPRREPAIVEGGSAAHRGLSRCAERAAS